MVRSHPAAKAIAANALTLGLVSISLLSPAFVSPVRADELPDDKMAPFQFSGVVNADNVYVRSYSSEDDYPVLKLSKGDAVVVVGSRFDYLKILPPPGTFCLVGKAWVEIRGDGSVGRVREEANNANVRIGSNLVPSYGKVVTQVKAGDDVKILGQQDNYFKIAPPAGAFAYVHKRFVDVVKKVEVVTDHNTMVVRQAGDPMPPKPVEPPVAKNPPANGDGLVPVPPLTEPIKEAGKESGKEPGKEPPVAVNPTTEPSDVAVTPTPATQPMTKIDAAGFDALEARFKAATALPLAEQPIDELMAGYQQVVGDKTLPESMLRLAAYRLNGLGLRKEGVATLKLAEVERAKRDAAQQPLIAEAKEMSDRIAANQFKRYTAVGTLRASALPHQGRMLYRLTDPATSRTVIYVADNSGSLAAYDGQFVGVRGTIADDTARQIKLLTPQTVEAVDPAELAKGTVSSGLVPPSLATASDGAR